MAAGCGEAWSPQPVPRGYALIEILFALGLAAVLTGVAIPQALVTIDASRTRAAARYLTSRIALARMQAVTRASGVAMRFDQDRRGFRISTYADGNHNGVRTRDIDAGIDRRIDPPVYLFEMFPGVDFGLTIDGRSTNPIQLGGTTLLSFTATGTSTSGSVYVRGRDGSQYAIRLLGATGRVRLLYFDLRLGDWVNPL